MRTIKPSSSHADYNGSGNPEQEAIFTLNYNRMSLEILLVVFILLCIIKFLVFYNKKE